jgi:hypothetical protein
VLLAGLPYKLGLFFAAIGALLLAGLWPAKVGRVAR